MNVGSSQWWSTASTMSSCHHFIVTTVPQITQLCQLCQCNCVRVQPYAYPQHMMVLRNIPYIRYGCGKQSVVVYSLNNFIMPSFCSSHSDPNYQNLGQLSQCNSVRRGAPICLSTANDGAQTLFIHQIWMRESVSGGLQPQQFHHTIIS
jgi:hypothetical protein